MGLNHINAVKCHCEKPLFLIWSYRFRALKLKKKKEPCTHWFCLWRLTGFFAGAEAVIKCKLKPLTDPLEVPTN